VEGHFGVDLKSSFKSYRKDMFQPVSTGKGKWSEHKPR